MSSKIVKQEGRKLTLQIEIDLDSSSMLASEEAIQSALNSAGAQASSVALQQFDTNGSAIIVDDKKYTSKGLEKKDIKLPMEK